MPVQRQMDDRSEKKIPSHFNNNNNNAHTN